MFDYDLVAHIPDEKIFIVDFDSVYEKAPICKNGASCNRRIYGISTNRCLCGNHDICRSYQPEEKK